MSAKVARIALPGEWDVSRKQELRELLHPHISADEVVIDLSETQFIDASVLGSLVGMVNSRMGLERPNLKVEGASAPIRRVISLTELDKILVVADEDAATDQRP